MGCIAVEGDYTLTICVGATDPTSTIKGTGELIVTDEYNAEAGGKPDSDGDHANDGDNARIGSREGKKCGNIIINGGNVEAHSTYHEEPVMAAYFSSRVMGADIGSGSKGSDGYIEINGGNVRCPGVASMSDHANSSIMEAACIGSGQNATGTVKICINGGDVYACAVDIDSVHEKLLTSELVEYGAAIGTGDSSKGNAIIEIHGGNVTAYAAKGHSDSDLHAHGAAIGTGEDYQSDSNTTITITGGNVTAYSTYGGKEGYGGAGIGVGDSWDGPGKVDITISGGNVTAYASTAATEGSGIGGGAGNANGSTGGCGDIIIKGSAVVNAFNCDPTGSAEPKAPGIGDGVKDGGGTLKIYGDACVVNTWGKYGIGNTGDGKFLACGYPADSALQVISGDYYEMQNNNSPQYWEPNEAVNQSVSYGDSKWRKIIFGKRNVYGQKNVYYLDADGNKQMQQMADPLKSVRAGGLDSLFLTNSCYVTGTVIIQTPIVVSGDHKIILCDGAELYAMGCIAVEDDAKLTICVGDTIETSTIKGTGELIVTDEHNAYKGKAADDDGDNDAEGANARIGSRKGEKCGTIIINGGNVTTYSTYVDYEFSDDVDGADIGSGYEGSGGTIEINGGNVRCKGAAKMLDLTTYPGSGTSNSNMYGACIGSGYHGTGTVNITINGGNVEAGTTFQLRGGDTSHAGGSKAAAIGTGYEAKGPAKIVINGGNVIAYGAKNAARHDNQASKQASSTGAGIGTGEDYQSTDATTITITGGLVSAYGALRDTTAVEVRSAAAGIGAGDDWDDDYGKVNITITGGYVTAYGSNLMSTGSGIGGGEDGGCGEIIIKGTANVLAGCTTTNITDFENCICAPGIGDGQKDAGGSLTIYGDSCVVETWGLNGIAKHLGDDESEFSRQFSAKAIPTTDATLIVHSGDNTYRTDNGNSPQTYTAENTITYGASKWRKIEFMPNTIEVTIGPIGYATLYYGNYALEVPEGITAWTGRAHDDGDKFKELHTYTKGDVIPKATAVVLYGAEGTYQFPVTLETGTTTDGNMLVGTDAEVTFRAYGNNRLYILSYENDGTNDIVGFYFQVAGGKSVTLSAHKAALKVESTDTGTRAILFDGATTGVSQVTGHGSQVTNIFDLQGRRLNRLQKGVNIVGGKKVIVK